VTTRKVVVITDTSVDLVCDDLLVTCPSQQAHEQHE
jgi:hypothetical protein